MSKCPIDTSVNYNVEDDTTRTRSEFENELNENKVQFASYDLSLYNSQNLDILWPLMAKQMERKEKNIALIYKNRSSPFNSD